MKHSIIALLLVLVPLVPEALGMAIIYGIAAGFFVKGFLIELNDFIKSIKESEKKGSND